MSLQYSNVELTNVWITEAWSVPDTMGHCLLVSSGWKWTFFALIAIELSRSTEEFQKTAQLQTN